MTARKVALSDARLRRLVHDLRLALEEQQRAEDERKEDGARDGR